MATAFASVETREVLRCSNPHCKLVQFKAANSRCRRCDRLLQAEPTATTHHAESRPVCIADLVIRIRHERHLSQRQLASRMQAPRTYISKIENNRATPTLGTLERLAAALEVGVSQLAPDSRSRREEEAAAVLADPFLAEIASLLPRIDSFHRSMIYQAFRDRARRTA
jgi:transcriptional regulator with XRE-family HTH domain